MKQLNGSKIWQAKNSWGQHFCSCTVRYSGLSLLGDSYFKGSIASYAFCLFDLSVFLQLSST